MSTLENTAEASLSSLSTEQMSDAAAPVVPTNRRFTLDGDEALERHLERTCARVLSGIRGMIPARKLEAVMLGGGYGRGEGGVLHGADGHRPYNDLEFYVVLRGNRHLNERRYHRRLEVLGEILTHLADVEVEFKIASAREMASREVSMFSYDLVVGHRLLWGSPAILEEWAHHRSATNISIAEATRLLMNRCSGLLLAREKLDRATFTAHDADFVRRNIAKAQLACGDAVLAARWNYHWSCRERHRRLEALLVETPAPWLERIVRHHAVGVEFKLHPYTTTEPREQLDAMHREVSAMARDCWLHLEGHRLEKTFPSARAYAEDSDDKCSHTLGLFNTLLNFRIDGWKRQVRPYRHPRERVFNALALLLWEPDALNDPILREQLRAELATDATTFPEFIAAYRRLWSRVQ